MKAWLSSVYHSNPFYHVHVLHFKKVRKQNSVTPQSLLAKWSKCLVCEQKYFKGLQSIFTEQREGVKDRHEPHEMTSGASWYAECPQSPAKPSPRHSLLFKPPPSLSPCLPFCPQIKYIWLLYPQKNFFFIYSNEAPEVISRGSWRPCTPSLLNPVLCFQYGRGKHSNSLHFLFRDWSQCFVFDVLNV